MKINGVEYSESELKSSAFDKKVSELPSLVKGIIFIISTILIWVYLVLFLSVTK